MYGQKGVAFRGSSVGKGKTGQKKRWLHPKVMMKRQKRQRYKKKLTAKGKL